ncbi:MAG TPA: winged helix-turn-helix domain-containing protein [Solirubrobacteraceae bacterium]
MKQISEIDDPRLVKALAHPLRVNILRVLQSRVASPSEIATELSAPLGNVSYHVRVLERAGLLKLERTRQRRGAIEHYYGAVGRLRITDKAWAQVPQIIKNAMLSATLDQAVRYVSAAVSTGGFDRGDAHVSLRPMTLDEQGFTDLAAAVKELLDRTHEIEAESEKRLAAGDHRDAEINAGLVMLLFEAPPDHIGLPTPEAKPHRRSKPRTPAAAKG